MSRSRDHYELGATHAQMGLPRYQWKDKYNQEDYDAGYDLATELLKKLNEDVFSSQQIPGLPGRSRQRW